MILPPFSIPCCNIRLALNYKTGINALAYSNQSINDRVLKLCLQVNNETGLELVESERDEDRWNAISVPPEIPAVQVKTLIFVAAPK